MLVHICCSVDSEYFIKCLKKDFPNERLLGYFYDPNIHPYSEFLLRYEDVKRSCSHHGVELICGEYDLNAWFDMSKGLENEPEKGKRCLKCFEFRLENTVLKALELNEKTVTTTLLMSPKKSYEQLNSVFLDLEKRYGISYFAPDYKKGGGSQEQFKLAKDKKLYHQNYCGCIYGLEKQRDKSVIYELISPIDRQVLPSSIEERLEIYTQILEFEKAGIDYEVIRDKFINYRLLKGRVLVENRVKPSFFLFNSHFKREFIKARTDKHCESIFLNKDEIKILSLKRFNEISNLKYLSVDELLKNPPNIEKQLEIREKITLNRGFSPIIVLDEIVKSSLIFEVKSEIFLDVREILVRI